MKRIPLVLLAVAAIFLALGTRALITQDEALVSSVLNELTFESVPNPTKALGAPPKFAVTRKTIAHLEKLMKQGQTIQVQADGSLKVMPAAQK